jgi:hypothetical protein
MSICGSSSEVATPPVRRITDVIKPKPAGCSTSRSDTEDHHGRGRVRKLPLNDDESPVGAVD